MVRSADGSSAPEQGEVIRYDGDFRPPEAPIVPVATGANESLVTAVRTVLDAAAAYTGRAIHWLPVELGDSAAEPVPPNAVRAFRRYRLGLVGPLDPADSAVATRLRRALDLSTAVSSHPGGTWRPSPLRTTAPSITLFRDVAEDAGAGLEFPPQADETAALGALLRDRDVGGVVPDDPVGYSVGPISRAGTEALVARAVDYAFEHDRNTVTIAHQADRRSGAEGAFRDWARSYLDREYGEGVVDEATHGDGDFPADELVLLERRTDELCRDLLADPGDYDVVLAPASGGATLAAVAGVAAGQAGGRAALGLGPGRLLVTAGAEPARNPIALLDAGCLLFVYIGWTDAAAVVRDAVTETLADGVVPRDPAGFRRRARPVDATDFAGAVVTRLEAESGEAGVGDVRTTRAERAAITDAIATLYNTVFTDGLDPADVELNQLRDGDEEADIYLPEVGLNFAYWRRWSVERRLEVLLHELAHVEEEPGEPDHGDAFYERLVELTEIALDRQADLAAAFGSDIDGGRVRRLVVESVHEETIEPGDAVDTRQAWLRDRFGLEEAGHY